MPTKKPTQPRRLTAEYIAGLKPRTTPYMVMDARTEGLGVRVHPSGRRNYILRVRFQEPGKASTSRRTHALGLVSDYATVQDARDAAEELRQRYRKHGDVKAIEARDIAQQLTLGEAVERFMAGPGADLKPTTQADLKRALHTGFGELFSTPLVDLRINPDLLDAFRRRKATAPTRASLEMRYARRVYSWVRTADKALDLEPWPTDELRVLKEIPSPRRKSRRLERDDIPGWWTATEEMSNARDRTLFSLLFYLGCRISELRHLTWNRVRLDAATPVVTFADTKTGHDVVVPLSTQAQDILASWKEESGAHVPLVFPAVGRDGEVIPIGSPTRAIRAHREGCGAAWSPHDLRRTYISIAEMIGGVPSSAVRKLTGHADAARDAHAGYIVTSPEALAPFSQVIADALEAMTRPRGSGQVVPLVRAGRPAS